MLDYTVEVENLNKWLDSISKFEKQVKNQTATTPERLAVRADMLMMIDRARKQIFKLSFAATVCRQRKKITTEFEKLHKDAVEYKHSVENNMIMYGLLIQC